MSSNKKNIKKIIKIDSGEKKPPKSPNGKYPTMGENKKIYSKGKSERANQNAGTITIGRDSGYVHYHEKPFWALSNCFIINTKNIKDLEYQTLYKLLQKNKKGIKNLKNLNKKGKNIKTKDLEFFLNNILNVFLSNISLQKYFNCKIFTENIKNLNHLANTYGPMEEKDKKRNIVINIIQALIA